MTGIREVRFINQTILTKSVCNGFKTIGTQNNKMFRLVFVGKTRGINSSSREFFNIDNRQ
jgi:hypothetical protein